MKQRTKLWMVRAVQMAALLGALAISCISMSLPLWLPGIRLADETWIPSMQIAAVAPAVAVVFAAAIALPLCFVDIELQFEIGRDDEYADRGR